MEYYRLKTALVELYEDQLEPRVVAMPANHLPVEICCR